MSIIDCEYRRDCSGLAIVASLIVGIIAAFLQITGAITVTSVFLWVLFSIAIVYLAVTLIAAALMQKNDCHKRSCCALSTVLIGILGTILFSVILLAITFAATSVIGAIIVGLLLFFFTLLITGTACLVRYLMNCSN